MNVRRFAGLLSALLIVACAHDPNRAPAPIVDRTKPVTRPSSTAPAERETGADWRPKVYTVKKGDTLYSIALEHGLDYREVAAWNQLSDPNLIKIDQQLRLTVPDENGDSGVVVKPLKPETDAGVTIRPVSDGAVTPAPTRPDTPAPVRAEVAYPKALKLSYSTDAATVARLAEGPEQVAARPRLEKPVEIKPVEVKPAEPKPTEPKPVESKPQPVGDDEVASWVWPATGRVVAPFSDSSKGIDIAGRLGHPVLASAGGRVVYAGTGLRGYGKLVIIKHNKTYLSAYAHNSQLLVKEGDNVKKGDKIAEMGNTDTEQVKLHFEIRRFGKPVDPTKYLTQ
ncbi:peptidoglycan DD-metalloendopeptidase family protein [Chitinimonas lacunae]|uniref:Peptidoglycan DD-metalloendopeptidase family protein n=1 Tax=Chitinimonas lacunae TaxID=1963018 RepID=A0ABV8MKX8_9NEIS